MTQYADGTTARVRYDLDEGVATIRLDNAPVNAISVRLRRDVWEALDRAERDGAGVVMILGGRAFFSAGADVSELGNASAESPTLAELVNRLAAMDVPTVAAVEGQALGGGLEIALACRHRLFSARARVALPEIRLGLIPGAGGTQRLPGIVGAVRALEMIATGDQVDGRRAHEWGLADDVVEAEDFGAAAAAWATRLESLATRAPATWDESVRAEFDALAARLSRRAVNARALAAVVEAVAAGAANPASPEGLALERRLFEELLRGDESAAQRAAFFADRRAVKRAQAAGGLTGGERVVVMGGGTMGVGIALSALTAGFEVAIQEPDEASRGRAESRVRAHYDRAVSRGRVSEADAANAIARLDVAAHVPDDETVVLVVEAIIEDLAAKRALFAELPSRFPNAVWASNTSYLDVEALAAATGRPDRVTGMHFFSPAEVMALVEVVRTPTASEEAVALTVAAAALMGKTPVVVGVAPGFVGNRMLARRTRQAERLLLEGASPQEIDAAVVAFGFKMGPFAVSDLSGLDIGWRNRAILGVEAPVADALVAAGRLGRKTGSGFYRYEGATPEPDPFVEELVIAEAAARGVVRRDIPAEELIDRLILPLVDEGAVLLAAGIAASEDDVDLVWRHGFGWPVTRGGPMWYARRRGLRAVCARLDELAAHDADLAASAALRQLADESEG